VRVTAEELEELRAKYAEMLAMRLEHDRRRAQAPHAEANFSRAREETPRLARLAARYPGALREMDDLELDEIRRRIAALERAIRDECAVEPWMAAIVRFHILGRGALCAKRWLRGQKEVDVGTARAFEAALASGTLLNAEEASHWASELTGVARPPGGKLSYLILSRVAQELGISRGEARFLVFGRPRKQDSQRRSKDAPPR
jgi:hypothetical protein